MSLEDGHVATIQEADWLERDRRITSALDTTFSTSKSLRELKTTLGESNVSATAKTQQLESLAERVRKLQDKLRKSEPLARTLNRGAQSIRHNYSSVATIEEDAKAKANAKADGQDGTGAIVGGRGSSGGPGGGGGGSGAAASTEMSNKNVVAAAAEANAKKEAKDKAAAEALKPEPQTAKEKVLAELDQGAARWWDGVWCGGG